MNCQRYESSKKGVDEPHAVAASINHYRRAQPRDENQGIQRSVEDCVEREGALLLPRHNKVVEGK